MLPVRNSHVTCRYGALGPWDGGKHRGIDFAAPVGTDIHAPWSGTVVEVGHTSWGSAYGLAVIIDFDHLPDGSPGYWGILAHNSHVLVHKGQRVTAGQVVAKSGDTGHVTGPHCHFEIQTLWHWRPASAGHVTRDPQPWLDAQPVIASADGILNGGRVLASTMHPGQQDSDSVRNLQTRLNQRAGAGLPITGNYGQRTTDAVMLFQRSQGWTGRDADGIAGPETIRRLGLTWVQD
jgi:hypothetical protein